jgi:hypothetical protein
MFGSSGAAGGWGYYSQVLGRHDQEVDTAFRLVRLLVERLQTVLGPDALGPEFGRVLDAFDVEGLKALAGQIEALVAGGQEAGAVRRLRELTGVSWDGAYLLFNQWPSFTADQKVHWARGVRLRQALAEVAPQG